MTKRTVPKRPLSQEEIGDAQRLKAACANFKNSHPFATQAWLAKTTGLGNKSLIWQYINGRIQLNHKAVLAFANTMGIHPSVISPRMGFPLSKDILTNKETQLIEAYRSASLTGRDLIDLAVVATNRSTGLLDGAATPMPMATSRM